MTPIVAFILGILVGGIACAVSAKVFGWFQKQTVSIESKV